MSQESDEEALMKELMKMVENDNDYERTHDFSSLELPHAPVKTSGNSTSPHLDMSPSEDQHSHQHMSPTYLAASQFLPGLMSSPDEKEATPFESGTVNTGFITL